MGILGRVNDIVRSNLNELVAKAENPEKLLKQAILDMEEHLRKAKKQVIDTIASEKLMEKKRLSVMEAANRWERRAELALRAGDEDLARQALLHKQEQLSVAQTMEAQVKVQREYVGALKQSVVSLEDRLRDAKAKKNALIARAKAARAREHAARSLGSEKGAKFIGESRAFDTFDRMEDKVLELEARVEAQAEMASFDSGIMADSALDSRFADMERELGLEEKLEALKKRMDGDHK